MVQSNMDALWNGQKFLVGANMPWKVYGYDYQDNIYDHDWWLGNKTQPDGSPSGFRKLAEAGANVVRLWVFADGSSLSWDSNGAPSLKLNEIANFKAMLDAADKFQIKVIPCMLDFLVARTKGPALSAISDWEKTTLYIDNVLKPLVAACRGDTRILAWDIMNEPEQLFPEENNKHLFTVPMWQVQRFVCRCAAEIHNQDQSALVTVGGNNLKYQYNKRGDDAWDYRQFLYSDENLKKSALSDPLVAKGLGFVDIGQVHFYGEWSYDYCQDPLFNGDAGNPLCPERSRNSRYSNLPVRGDDRGFDGKPVILGEVQPNIKGIPAYTADQLANRAVQQGYSGILFWSAFTEYTSADGKGDTKGSYADMKDAIWNHKDARISRSSPSLSTL